MLMPSSGMHSAQNEDLLEKNRQQNQEIISLHGELQQSQQGSPHSSAELEATRCVELHRLAS
jgi:hypothetical protein